MVFEAALTVSQEKTRYTRPFRQGACAVFFVISKMLAFVCQPLAWACLGLLLAIRAYANDETLRALRWIQVVFLVLILTGWKFLPQTLIKNLEDQYPSQAGEIHLAQFEGMIVLGGALEDGEFWTRPHQPALNSAAERMTAVIPLHREYPSLKILFTGGEGQLLGEGPKEAERARTFFEEMGIPKDKLLLESHSHNTWENAEFSKNLPGVDSSRPWLLITSAFHMPRSMAAFQRAGWNVTAYPVDYRAPEHPQIEAFDFADGALLWRLTLHEYLGLCAYRLTGKL